MRFNFGPVTGIILGLIGLIACTPDEEATDLPQAELSPTPSPGPFLARTTWTTVYLEYWSDVVLADTDLFINFEEQSNNQVVCLIYHLWGILVVNGTEVPPGKAAWLYGTYLYPGIIELEGELADVKLNVTMEVDTQHSSLKTTLDLENGSYIEVQSMYQYHDYIPFNY